jgi:hypothetical protein
MTEVLPSLIRGEQSELFDESELPAGLEVVMPEETQRKRFTAEQVARNQGRYREIVHAIAGGMPVRSICKAFSVSHHIVKIIREREPDLVATEKKRMSASLGHAARMGVEEFMEQVARGEVEAKVLPVAVGIFLDKKALLDGEATARVEHVSSGLPSMEEFRRLVTELPAARVTESVDLGTTELLSEGKEGETR